jgi:DNA replication and repair protein RecF
VLESGTIRGAGHTPLVLLDDPFAELDARRAGRILELLGGADLPHQTILAVPRSTDIPAEMTALRRYRIVSGAIEESQ